MLKTSVFVNGQRFVCKYALFGRCLQIVVNKDDMRFVDFSWLNGWVGLLPLGLIGDAINV